MKKSILMILLVMAFLVFNVSTLIGDSADDYRVIKKAEKSQNDPEDMTTFKILVTDNTTNKIKVRITLPICLLEMLSECEDDFKIKDVQIKDHCRINLKQVLNILKKKGHQYMIEVNDEKETVKIWFE